MLTEGSDGEDSVGEGREQGRLREGKAAGSGSGSMDLGSNDPSRQVLQPPPRHRGARRTKNPASPRCSGQRSSMPLTAVPPAFAVMVQEHPDISGMCGCEWVQAELLRVTPMSLCFISRPGCESRGK